MQLSLRGLWKNVRQRTVTETQTGYVENGQEWLGRASNMGDGLAQIAPVQEARRDDFRRLYVNDVRKTER